MKIEDLLERYFEGTTDGQEEATLRRYFRQANVAPELEIYRPLFNYIDVERENHLRSTDTTPRRVSLRAFVRKYTWQLAASVTLLLGMAGGIAIYESHRPASDSVWIDGVCYTQETLVRQQAQLAFQDVSFSQEDIFNELFTE
ncbi:MAG: hypothetical protein LBM61_08575 [Prevotellaceae bacterium]|jgi:hypothetical protein|nr:hypothetical protein [Prevotellaceae bacterium]